MMWDGLFNSFYTQCSLPISDRNSMKHGKTNGTEIFKSKVLKNKVRKKLAKVSRKINR